MKITAAVQGVSTYTSLYVDSDDLCNAVGKWSFSCKTTNSMVPLSLQNATLTMTVNPDYSVIADGPSCITDVYRISSLSHTTGCSFMPGTGGTPWLGMPVVNGNGISLYGETAGGGVSSNCATGGYVAYYDCTGFKVPNPLP